MKAFFFILIISSITLFSQVEKIDEEDLSATFPGKVKTVESVKTVKYQTTVAGKLFMIAKSSHVAKILKADNATLLFTSIAAFVQKLNAKIILKTDITNGTVKGKEVTMKLPNGVFLFYQVYIYDTKQYQVITSSKTDKKDKGSLDFFKSFKIKVKKPKKPVAP